MTISEQIAVAAIFYFGQVFVFCRLINKNVLEWFILIMCKEHILSRSTNLSRNHPTLFLIKKRMSTDAQHLLTVWLAITVQNLATSFWTVTLSNHGSVCFSRQSQSLKLNKQPPSFRKH